MAVRTTIGFGDRMAAAGFGAYLAAFRAMPLERASQAGAALFSLVGPRLPAHQTALRNLALAFPDETPHWRRDVARAMWDHLGRSAGEFAHLAQINAYRDDGRIEVEGVERLDAIKASGKGAVFVGGHFSNWEIMAAAIVQRGVRCHVTYRPANNPLIDQAIIDVRQTYGVTLQSAKGKEGGMGLLRGLAKGETVALMNDQKYNEGVPALFFGHDCMTADGPTRLAMRFGAPILPLSVRRLREGDRWGVRFRVTVHPEIKVPAGLAQLDAIRATVAEITAFVEARVREAPEQWFWVHRRWPKEAWDAAGV